MNTAARDHTFLFPERAGCFDRVLSNSRSFLQLTEKPKELDCPWFTLTPPTRLRHVVCAGKLENGKATRPVSAHCANLPHGVVESPAL